MASFQDIGQQVGQILLAQQHLRNLREQRRQRQNVQERWRRQKKTPLIKLLEVVFVLIFFFVLCPFTQMGTFPKWELPAFFTSVLEWELPAVHGWEAFKFSKQAAFSYEAALQALEDIPEAKEDTNVP